MDGKERLHRSGGVAGSASRSTSSDCGLACKIDQSGLLCWPPAGKRYPRTTKSRGCNSGMARSFPSLVREHVDDNQNEKRMDRGEKKKESHHPLSSRRIPGPVVWTLAKKKRGSPKTRGWGASTQAAAMGGRAANRTASPNSRDGRVLRDHPPPNRFTSGVIRRDSACVCFTSTRAGNDGPHRTSCPKRRGLGLIVARLGLP